MTKEAFVVIVKMAYRECPVRCRPVGVFGPDDIISLFISDRSTRKDIECGVKKISLSVGGGKNVRVGYEPAMRKYSEEIKPLLLEKYGANFELVLEPITRPQVVY